MIAIMHPKQSERGAALLIVIVVMTLVSAAAVAMIDELRFAARRTGNIRDRDQAMWHIAGIESVARRLIERGWRDSPTRSTLNDAWATTTADFPTERGRVAGRIRDAGNCFNLNALVTVEGPVRLAADDQGIRRFRNLLTALGFERGRSDALAAALTDWIDTDFDIQPQGAEDSTYMALSPPYRTGGTLVMDVSELLAVRGFDAEVVARLRPYVCARPTAGMAVLNVNTLTVAHAPLLVALIGEDLSVADAERAIERRPVAGFESLAAFWSADELAPFDHEDLRGLTTLATRVFAVESDVAVGNARIHALTIVRLELSGETIVETRALGAAL